MYQLYCARHTYAMGAHLLLEELDVAYRIIEVNFDLDRQPQDFIEASPHGRVPAMRHQHGTVFESGAIAQYLADMHADQGFSVVPAHSFRAEYLQWLYYLSSTIQPEVLNQFHPEYYFEDSRLQQQFRRASMQRLSANWQVLENAYARDSAEPWLFEGRPTAVDFCLAIQLQWEECFAESIAQYPNLARLLGAVSERPAFRKIMRWHESDAGA